jgi:hypothetical protein
VAVKRFKILKPLLSKDSTARTLANVKKVARVLGKASRYSLSMDRRLQTADYPLAVAQIDHTPMDLIVVDEELRQSIQRPSLTVVIDVYSRMVLGCAIYLEKPSAFTAGLAIAYAVLGKEDWLGRRSVCRPPNGLAGEKCAKSTATMRTTARTVIWGYGNDSVQNGPFGYLDDQPVCRRRRTEVLPMPSRLAISDFESFSLR